jgi:hypothetical protein
MEEINKHLQIMTQLTISLLKKDRIFTNKNLFDKKIFSKHLSLYDKIVHDLTNNSA